MSEEMTVENVTEVESVEMSFRHVFRSRISRSIVHASASAIKARAWHHLAVLARILRW